MADETHAVTVIGSLSDVLYQGNLPEVPLNLIVEILIVLDVVIIIYLIKADPLEIRQTDSDVQRLSSLCRRFWWTALTNL